VIPLVGITMMSQELHKGNNELLMLTTLKRDRVVIEKFLALWSLSLLMLFSLIPYTLVPYWVNGMRIFVLGELICSIILHSAVTSAMVLAISGYTRIQFRLLFFLLIGSVSLICLAMCFFKANLDDPGNLKWHYLNALIATVALVIFGLASAKSQLKLTFFFYEIKPTNTVSTLMFFSPIVAGIIAGITLGHASALGFLGMAILAWYCDEPTKPKKELARQKLNLPEGTTLLD